MKKLIELKFDEGKLLEMYKQELQKRLEKIEAESLLMNGADLRKYLKLSWPTITELFLSRDDFKKIKVGSKYLFFRPDVDAFIENWVQEVEAAGGDAKSVNKVKKAPIQKRIAAQ